MRSVFGVACGNDLAEGVEDGQVCGSVNGEGTVSRIRIDLETLASVFVEAYGLAAAVGEQAAFAVLTSFHTLNYDITLVESALLAGVARHAGADIVND